MVSLREELEDSSLEIEETPIGAFISTEDRSGKRDCIHVENPADMNKIANSCIDALESWGYVFIREVKNR